MLVYLCVCLNIYHVYPWWSHKCGLITTSRIGVLPPSLHATKYKVNYFMADLSPSSSTIAINMVRSSGRGQGRSRFFCIFFDWLFVVGCGSAWSPDVGGSIMGEQWNAKKFSPIWLHTNKLTKVERKIFHCRLQRVGCASTFLYLPPNCDHVSDWSNNT